MPRRTSLCRRCYNPFSKENDKHDPCSLRTISATLQKKYPSIPIGAKLCGNCRKEISQLALLSSLYSHNDPIIEDASVINNNSPPIPENDILMEEDEIFADPSTSEFEKSKTDCSDENHQVGMQVLEQIKEKLQKSASNSEKVLLLTLAPKSWDILLHQFTPP